MAFEDRVEGTGRAAVTIDDHDLAIAGRQLLQLAIDRFHDFLRIEMMHRRHAVDVDIPPVLVDDRFHFPPARSADQEGDLLHRSDSSSGNARTEMNESLKSGRPESSTYSILSGSSTAIWRSRKESSGT